MKTIRDYIDLVESAGPSAVIYRWVDEAAVKSYLRIDAMKARVRHFMPAKMAGQFHSKFMTGISFSDHPTKWRNGGVCFVVNRRKITNDIADINGQAVYLLSQMMSAVQAGIPQTKQSVMSAREEAFKMSKEEPDEVFVIGDLRGLSKLLVKIIVKECDPKTFKAIKAYAASHNIPVESDASLTEARRNGLKSKMRPDAKDIAHFREIRERVRAEEGGGGMCHWVSEIIENEYGWERMSGVYVNMEDEVVIWGHLWNQLPDGAILDATADQIGEGHDIRIIEPNDPEIKRYRLEWNSDYNPDLHDEYPELKGVKWSGEYDDVMTDRLRKERGHDWWVTDREQWLRYHDQQARYAGGRDIYDPHGLYWPKAKTKKKKGA